MAISYIELTLNKIIFYDISKHAELVSTGMRRVCQQICKFLQL